MKYAAIIFALIFGIWVGFVAACAIFKPQDAFVLLTENGGALKMNNRTGETWRVGGDTLEWKKIPDSPK